MAGRRRDGLRGWSPPAHRTGFGSPSGLLCSAARSRPRSPSHDRRRLQASRDVVSSRASGSRGGTVFHVKHRVALTPPETARVPSAGGVVGRRAACAYNYMSPVRLTAVTLRASTPGRSLRLAVTRHEPCPRTGAPLRLFRPRREPRPRGSSPLVGAVPRIAAAPADMPVFRACLASPPFERCRMALRDRPSYHR